MVVLQTPLVALAANAAKDAVEAAKALTVATDTPQVLIF